MDMIVYGASSGTAPILVLSLRRMIQVKLVAWSVHLLSLSDETLVARSSHEVAAVFATGQTRLGGLEAARTRPDHPDVRL